VCVCVCICGWVYVCVCVYMGVWVFGCMYIHRSRPHHSGDALSHPLSRKYVCGGSDVCVCVHLWVCVCLCVCVYMGVWVFGCMYIHRSRPHHGGDALSHPPSRKYVCGGSDVCVCGWVHGCGCFGVRVYVYTPVVRTTAEMHYHVLPPPLRKHASSCVLWRWYGFFLPPQTMSQAVHGSAAHVLTPTIPLSNNVIRLGLGLGTLTPSLTLTLTLTLT